MTTKTMTRIAILTTLLIVLGFVPPIPLTFIPVPLVLQNLGVMVIALVLDGKSGSLAMGLFALLTLFIPAISGSTLFPVLAGPTAGYVLAWLFVPFLTSLLLNVIGVKNFWTNLLISVLIGVLFVDGLGAIWLAKSTQISLQSAFLSNLVFLPGDSLKAIVASLIATRLKDNIKR